jgi:hypothetical protein
MSALILFASPLFFSVLFGLTPDTGVGFVGWGRKGGAGAEQS